MLDADLEVLGEAGLQLVEDLGARPSKKQESSTTTCAGSTGSPRVNRRGVQIVHVLDARLGEQVRVDGARWPRPGVLPRERPESAEPTLEELAHRVRVPGERPGSLAAAEPTDF